MKYLFFLSLILSFSSVSSLRAQQSFNVFSYPATPGDTGLENHQWIIRDNQAGTAFILIPLSAASSNAMTNFNSDWRDYVANGNRTLDFPHKKTSPFGQGWTHISGQSRVIINGQTFWVQLHSFTRKNQKAAILFLARDISQQPLIDQFIQGLSLLDQPVPAPEQPSATADSQPADTNSSLNNIAPSAPPAPASSQPPAPASHAYKQFGNIFYLLPSGWTEKQVSSSLMLIPGKLRGEENYQIFFLSPLTGVSDFKSAISSTFTELQQGFGERLEDSWHSGPTEPRQNLQGFNYVMAFKQTHRSNDLNLQLTLCLVKTNQGMERILLVDHEFRAAETKGLYMKYSALTGFEQYYDATDFIASLQFIGKPLVPIHPAGFRSNKICGVWVGLGGDYQSVTVGYNVTNGYLILLDNGMGYRYRNPPLNGLADLHPWTEKWMYPGNWGRYTFKNDTGSLNTSFSGLMSFRVSGRELKVLNHKTSFTYIKLPDFNGARLSGTYANSDGKRIHFDASGRFSDEGALDVIAHSTQYKPFHVTYAPGQGRYEIKDYSMLFYYDDGRFYQNAFVDFKYNPSDRSPHELHLGYHSDLFTLQ